MQDIRYVMIHTPGPNWKAGVPAFEQEGLRQHVEHFQKLHAAGKLAMGGPFLDAASGGMMIPAANLAEAEIVEFANADPTVASGLLKVEVRQWFVKLNR